MNARGYEQRAMLMKGAACVCKPVFATVATAEIKASALVLLLSAVLEMLACVSVREGGGGALGDHSMKKTEFELWISHKL